MHFEHGRPHRCGKRGHRAAAMMEMMPRHFGGHVGRGGHFGAEDPFGRGGGGRRGGRMFAGGELRLLLLHLVAEQPRHGYDLIRAIGDLAGGEYAPSPGVVYPTLSLLVDEALIAEEAGDGPRKAFAVTDPGRAELADRDAELEPILARLRTLAEQRDRADSPPVRRAMGNLRTAVRDRVMTQGFGTETAHAIADILDEAARRIERL